MPISVTSTDSPDRVLDTAGPFLAGRPVAHNLILTLLHARVAHPEPGCYWVAAEGDDVVGVVFRSPLGFHAAVTPMAADVVADVARGPALRVRATPRRLNGHHD